MDAVCVGKALHAPLSVSAWQQPRCNPRRCLRCRRGLVAVAACTGKSQGCGACVHTAPRHTGFTTDVASSKAHRGTPDDSIPGTTLRRCCVCVCVCVCLDSIRGPAAFASASVPGSGASHTLFHPQVALNVHVRIRLYNLEGHQRCGWRWEEWASADGGATCRQC